MTRSLALCLLALCACMVAGTAPPPSPPPSPPPYNTPPGEAPVVLSSEALGSSSDALGQGIVNFNFASLGVQNGKARSSGPGCRARRRPSLCGQPPRDSGCLWTARRVSERAATRQLSLCTDTHLLRPRRSTTPSSAPATCATPSLPTSRCPAPPTSRPPPGAPPTATAPAATQTPWPSACPRPGTRVGG